jgi:hypothetical protein
VLRFSRRWLFRLWPPSLWHRAVVWLESDISEEYSALTFRHKVCRLSTIYIRLLCSSFSYRQSLPNFCNRRIMIGININYTKCFRVNFTYEFEYCLQCLDYDIAVLGHVKLIFQLCYLCHCSMEVLDFGNGSKSSYKDTAIHFCHHSSIESDFHVFPASYLPGLNDDVQKTALNARASRKCATLFTSYWTLQERKLFRYHCDRQEYA